MKHLLLNCLFLSSFFSFSAKAQSNVTGAWEGKLAAAGNLRMILHVSPAGGDSLLVHMDNPDQGVTGIAADKAYLAGDSLFLFWPAMKAAFKGKVQDSVLAGVWLQGGARLPLALRRTEKPSGPLRPQTPKPPFLYTSKDLTFQNKDKSMTYGATLTIPEGKGSCPAVLLLTGSGPQNRDEEVFGHKPFAVLADYLTRRGYVVLRVDDRGVGQTTGSMMESSEKELLADATTAFEFLKLQPQVNKKKLGILGHSQGGISAVIMGAERADVAFLILLAAPGVNGVEMMTVQNEKVLRSMGIPGPAAGRYALLYRQVAAALLYSKDSAAASLRLSPIVTAWLKETDKQTAMFTTGIHDSASQATYVATFAAMANDPMMRDIYRYDPAPYLKKIKAKVLALNGGEDIQVVAAQNLAGIRQGLSSGKSKSFEVKELPGLNHLFQKCIKCTVPEYGQLEETLNPALLEAIANWLERWNTEK